MKVQAYRSLWLIVVNKHLAEQWEGVDISSIKAKLLRVRPDRCGELKENRYCSYARSHFPSIIKQYEELRDKAVEAERRAHGRVKPRSCVREPVEAQLSLF